MYTLIEGQKVNFLLKCIVHCVCVHAGCVVPEGSWLLGVEEKKVPSKVQDIQDTSSTLKTIFFINFVRIL